MSERLREGGGVEKSEINPHVEAPHNGVWQQLSEEDRRLVWRVLPLFASLFLSSGMMMSEKPLETIGSVVAGLISYSAVQVWQNPERVRRFLLDLESQKEQTTWEDVETLMQQVNPDELEGDALAAYKFNMSRLPEMMGRNERD